VTALGSLYPVDFLRYVLNMPVIFELWSKLKSIKTEKMDANTENSNLQNSDNHAIVDLVCVQAIILVFVLQSGQY
jgi:hypothetical protein